MGLYERNTEQKDEKNTNETSENISNIFDIVKSPMFENENFSFCITVFHYVTFEDVNCG